ncbi:MAG TPA: response regulator [Polyangiaceae bacterium]|nr:response regulator [Polyangiaceae bacterium]
MDDEEGVRASLAANLELEGYEAVEASDGVEAVAAFRRRPFDLVITDVRMPKMNGVEAFREMKRVRPEVPVVMMTAFATEGLLEDALVEGAFAVVYKPFPMRQIFRLVAEGVRRPAVLVAGAGAAELAAALSARGLRARAAGDLAGAAEAAGDDVDVCVLDLDAGAGALAAQAALGRRGRPVSLIAVASEAPPESIHRFMSGGGYACLRRPHPLGELVRAVARARGDAAKS